MRDHLLLYVNGQRHEVRGADAFLTLADFVRERLRLTGTKIVCAEGDCGACTVLVGRPRGRRLHYLPVDSCICFVYQMDGCHIVTVEGLTPGRRENDPLHPVQEAMVRHHGSQCGFCTPGIVMAMAGAFETDDGRHRPEPLDADALRRALSGNLCRCTGYVQIIEAGESIDPASVPPLAQLYPEQAMLADLAGAAAQPAAISAVRGGQTMELFAPRTLEEAVVFKASHPDAAVVCGATDLGVQHNKGLRVPSVVLDLSHVEGLSDVVAADGVLRMGAAATWTAIGDITEDLVPEFHRIITLFGSPQIRNAGTIGGNIVNGSPIADSLPFLFVTHAEVEIAGGAGRRRVALTRLYRGYKQLDLAPDELVAEVRVPLPRRGEILRLYKVSKRRDMDISTFTAAVLARLGDGGVIEWMRVAMGGVAPVVLRLARTEQWLEGRPFTEETMREAGHLAAQEISPITDVRGEARYRRRLAENILVKFYHDAQPAPAGAVR
ncbi:MAG: FAD binding domain-containing protein [Candidatus Sumerlaeaceae bacterium]|nr:FAD binding domain-containing protein [Candidatus Sumerlaeaceae bacterium]